MHIKIIFFSFALLLISSCTRVVQTNEIDVKPLLDEAVDMHTSENALDWQGTYQGTLPCADCQGIETTLTLMTNKTYTLTQTYIKGKTYTLSGRFEWNLAGSTITLLGTKAHQRYKVVENGLLHLDQNGEVIAGDLSELYRLRKK